MPPSIPARTTVRLFTGMGAGVYFDYSTFSFQVPIVLSAPRAARAVAAKIKNSLTSCFRIVVSFRARDSKNLSVTGGMLTTWEEQRCCQECFWLADLPPFLRYRTARPLDLEPIWARSY